VKKEKGKRKARRNGRPIRQNRPNYRKKVLNPHFGGIKYRHRGQKIKGKTWEKVKPKSEVKTP
jgi:hypothetical protein